MKLTQLHPLFDNCAIENIAEVKEIGEHEITHQIKINEPFLIRNHSTARDLSSKVSLDSLTSNLGKSSISVEHKLRWKAEKIDMPAEDYFRNIETSNFYWRQAELSRLNISELRLPDPIGARNTYMCLDNIWVGPADTIQTFHQDNHNDIITNRNFFLQIQGFKYIALASPDDSHVFRNSPLFGSSSRHSSVTPFDLNLYRECASLVHAIVGPGDILYIPDKFWHYVRSMTISISISRWWFENSIAEMMYFAKNGIHTHPTVDMKQAYSDLASLGGVSAIKWMLQEIPTMSAFHISKELIAIQNSGYESHLTFPTFES